MICLVSAPFFSSVQSVNNCSFNPQSDIDQFLSCQEADFKIINSLNTLNQADKINYSQFNLFLFKKVSFPSIVFHIYFFNYYIIIKACL